MLPQQFLCLIFTFSAALEVQDYDKAGKEKNALEEAQRDRRRQREAKKLEHIPKFFTMVLLLFTGIFDVSYQFIFSPQDKLENGEEHWLFNTENNYWDLREVPQVVALLSFLFASYWESFVRKDLGLTAITTPLTASHQS